jgi:coproporphyrinogen III oxidase-like Fe-S oxidoreductase
MLAERLLTAYLRRVGYRRLALEKLPRKTLPRPRPGRRYMLYAHVPFCELLCPYCSFNRYPFREALARQYFKQLREEMEAVARLGYDFSSLYIGGGTPTILIDELVRTIDLARTLFSITEVSTETNPDHLTPARLTPLQGRVDRLSVGVQSFDDGLLRRMKRLDKYGSGEQILARLRDCAGALPTLNVDMIFNFPGQDEAMLARDLALLAENGANQVTFYPLMASPVVERSLAATMGKVDYRREPALYRFICEHLPPGFEASSAWAFSRNPQGLIDEYIVDYDEYVGIGSGAFSYLDGTVYSNTFSLSEYHQALSEGRFSVSTRFPLNDKDRLRYHFMMRLFGLSLNKREFEANFGVSLERSLWKELAFLRLAGAFSRDDRERLELSPTGRYLVVVLMREFFIGVNSIRDQARRALPPAERELIFGEPETCPVASPLTSPSPLA